MKRAAACEDFPGLVTRLRELSARQEPPCFLEVATTAEECLQMLGEDPGARKIVDRAEELLQAAVRAGRRGATRGSCAPFNVLTFNNGQYVQPAFKSAELTKLQQGLPGLSDIMAQVCRTGRDPTKEQIQELMEKMLAMEGGGTRGPQEGEGSSRGSRGGGEGTSSSSGGGGGRVKSTKVSKSACVVCGGCQGSTQACGRCKSVWYCSKEHQVGGVEDLAQTTPQGIEQCHTAFHSSQLPSPIHLLMMPPTYFTFAEMWKGDWVMPGPRLAACAV
jgi:hypothetical protein